MLIVRQTLNEENAEHKKSVLEELPSFPHGRYSLGIRKMFTNHLHFYGALIYNVILTKKKKL